MSGPRRQRGLGLFGLIVAASVVVGALIIGAQVGPTVHEFLSARKALESAVEGAATAAEIRSAFDRQAAIDDITSVTGRDLEIDKGTGGNPVARFRYEKRIPVAGRVSIAIDYSSEARAR